MPCPKLHAQGRLLLCSHISLTTFISYAYHRLNSFRRNSKDAWIMLAYDISMRDREYESKAVSPLALICSLVHAFCEGNLPIWHAKRAPLFAEALDLIWGGNCTLSPCQTLHALASNGISILPCSGPQNRSRFGSGNLAIDAFTVQLKAATALRCSICASV